MSNPDIIRVRAYYPQVENDHVAGGWEKKEAG
jgi:hypothetical protein